MRKYNSKMKKTMIIIGILFVIFIVIFSLFLRKAIQIDKTFYEVSSGAILFDREQNKVVTNNTGIIRVRWGGDYYLNYNDDYYNLGSHSVVYDASSGDINLYGKYYEVLKDGKVEVIEGENIIKSSVNSKFYKLADRKYLIIDRVIESSDSSFLTSNYLMIHLDKMGSFVWTLMDGEKDIVAIRVLVKEHFGDEAEPLYERLARYFQILDSYSFVVLN